jgi:ATP-dependent DNA helicase RecQ
MTPPATSLDPDVTRRAAELLAALAGPGAELRADQAAAVSEVVAHGRRVLVVQRTGFGKSAIYFIATRMRRDAGAGPTLVVSPLLALMRDQVAAAERMGVRSVTINSTNVDEWAEIQAEIAAGDVDLVCVSPERLNSPGFVRNVLPTLAAGLGLLVVDEAHCISDWGHDFRPDYRRIRTAIAGLAPGTPVIATTATANARVTADVAEQLGDDVVVLRGPLDRESLELGVVVLPTAAERLAWVAQRIAEVPGTGIVYCLTVAQTELAAAFLASRGIDAPAYSSATPPDERNALEARFRANDVKALVATSALGMGVDKADVAFVFHLGAPPSPIAYYQQVGRAGRAVDRAEAVLLPSPEDRAIWSWFAAVGLPDEAPVRRVLDALGDEPVSTPSLETVVDLKRTRLETLLKILDVDGAVRRVDGGWVRTGAPWAYDHERVARVRSARTTEADAMAAYACGSGCLMRFLREALDDPGAADCGRCWRCTGRHDPVALAPDVVAAALVHLRGVEVVLEPRRQWARGLDEPRGNVRADERAEPGRALCRQGDDGWWPVVAAAFEAGEPTDELVEAVFAALKRWDWDERPAWVTWVPSTSPSRSALLAALAERIASAGRLGCGAVVRRVRDARPQGELANGAHRLANVWGAFAVDLTSVPDPSGPVLVLDDRYDSGWTATVVAAELRRAGSGPVLPFVLARV